MQDAEKNKRRRPMNLRKKSRLLIIPASTEPTKILISADPCKTRIWLDDLPVGTEFEIPNETVDKKP